MNDSPITTDWVRQIKEHEDREALKSDAAVQRLVAATKTIQADRPAFWRQMLKDLTVALHELQSIGVQAAVHNVGSQLTVGEAYRVSVCSKPPIPKPTYTDIFYNPGSAAIRCRPVHGEAFELQWCVDDEGKVALQGPDGWTLNSEQAVQAIVQPMVDRVRPE